MTPAVNRRDITLYEEPGELSYTTTGAETPPSVWTAALDGPLPTGERVEMARSGATSAEALGNLEAAIKENGWETR